jgi:hypothetical protein
MKSLLNALYKSQWVVYVKPPFAGPKAVVKYTDCYTHRVAISNNRLVAVDEKSVTFQWKDYSDHNRQKRMTLQGVEFIRRFMLHVIPSGFVRIRHYGFLSNRNRKGKLDACRKALGMKSQDAETNADIQPSHWYDIVIKFMGIDPRICPACKKGLMKPYREICATSPSVAAIKNAA